MMPRYFDAIRDALSRWMRGVAKPAPVTDLSTSRQAITADGPWSIIDHLYEGFAKKEHVPGLVFGLVSNARLVHLNCLGYADLEAARRVTPETCFRLASVTKNVTALAVLQLEDEGAVSLDSPVEEYVPEFGGANRITRDAGSVTLRDLLNHVGGLVTDDAWADRRLGLSTSTFTHMIESGGLAAQAPGLAYEYSNLGYALLGRVITNVSGRPYQQFISERILRPLGMTNTTFAFHDVPAERRASGYGWRRGRWTLEPAELDGEFGAMGGLVSNAPDYARYLAFLLDAWPARDDEESGPVRRATRRQLAQVHAPPMLPSPRQYKRETIYVSSAYAYGLVHSFDPLLGEYLHHVGGLPGYGAHVLFAPHTGNGLFAFGNRTYAPLEAINIRAASTLSEAGLWTAQPRAPSPALTRAAEAVLRAYQAGRIEAAQPLLADNLLLDQPAAERNALLATLRSRFGEARSQTIEPRHERAGRFILSCQFGRLSGQIALTPGPAAMIQRLQFESSQAPTDQGRPCQ
jgi:D-alanyl-D-alanine-carboxypeptidase/D-alanyl-D-alanine-endopeptidase